jgi:hypothetical protein
MQWSFHIAYLHCIRVAKDSFSFITSKLALSRSYLWNCLVNNLLHVCPRNQVVISRAVRG